MTDQHDHCWHSTGIQLTSMPPWDVQVCCHCGQNRNLRLGQTANPTGHGPHFPRLTPARIISELAKQQEQA